MDYIYIKWIWWETETAKTEVPVLIYSKVGTDDFEVERFEFYRKDRSWGHCDNPKENGRTVLSDVETGIANPQWGIETINQHARENKAAYYLFAITPAEYYTARKTHIGLDMPTDV